MSLDEFIPGWNPGTDGEAVLDGETPNVFSTLDAGTRTYALSRSVFFTSINVEFPIILPSAVRSYKERRPIMSRTSHTVRG